MNDKTKVEKLKNAVDEYLDNVLEFRDIANAGVSDLPINNSDIQSIRMICMTLPISNLRVLSDHLDNKLSQMEE